MRSRGGEAGIDWPLLLVSAATTCVSIFAHWTNISLLTPAVAAQLLLFGPGRAPIGQDARIRRSAD